MSFLMKIQSKYKITAAPNRKEALEYVGYVIDDQGRELPKKSLNPKTAILVGWQCGFEPMYVAIQNDDGSEFPGGYLSEGDAEDIAIDFLNTKNWFSAEEKECDYIHMPR